MARRSEIPQSVHVLPGKSHELKDISLKVVLVVLAIIFFAAFAIHGVLWAWLISMPEGADQTATNEWHVIAKRVPQPAQSFPALQLSPQQDLKKYLQTHEQDLRSYKWVNPDTDTIQIPIERAMQIVVEKGLPNFRK